MPDIQIDIDAAVHGPRATIVELTAVIDGEVIAVTGEALRHPEDKNDETLAALLAHGRALESLGRKLQKRAQGLVRHNDHLAALKERQKKAKTIRKRKSTGV